MVHTEPSIRDRVESQLPSLSTKQRRVGEYLLANPTTMLFASVVEVAENAQVDPATVVRFAKRLGFSGFPELRAQLREEHSVPVRKTDDLLDIHGAVVGKDAAAIYEQVQAQAKENLQRTFETLDMAALESAITHILGARRVVIVGAGFSRGLALHLTRVIQTAQVPVQIVEDWYDLLFDAATLTPADVMFAITAQRYSTVTIKALKVAKECGASTILLTDATMAPGINNADISLFFSPRSVGQFYSPVGASAVIDCLAAGLAARVPDAVKESLERHIGLAIDHDLSYW